MGITIYSIPFVCMKKPILKCPFACMKMKSPFLNRNRIYFYSYSIPIQKLPVNQVSGMESPSSLAFSFFHPILFPFPEHIAVLSSDAIILSYNILYVV